MKIRMARTSDGLMGATYFHGSAHEFEAGAVLTPESGDQDGEYVYLADSARVAALYAQLAASRMHGVPIPNDLGGVYEVEPLGSVEDDPVQEWGGEHRTSGNVRVLRKVDPASTHTAGPAGNMVPFERFPILTPQRFGPKDVKVLRMAEQDIKRLHPGQQAKVREAIEALKAGTAQVEAKERHPLVGSYTVRVSASLRMGLYLTEDQPGGDPAPDWVVYWVGDHTYSEAERRMQMNPGVRTASTDLYVRFGEIPPNYGNSFNYRDEFEEGGVSVYRLGPDGMPVNPSSGVPHGMPDEVLETMQGFVWMHQKGHTPEAYVVDGLEVGTGSDGEPLLDPYSIEIVRDWDNPGVRVAECDPRADPRGVVRVSQYGREYEREERWIAALDPGHPLLVQRPLRDLQALAEEVARDHGLRASVVVSLVPGYVSRAEYEWTGSIMDYPDNWPGTANISLGEGMHDRWTLLHEMVHVLLLTHGQDETGTYHGPYFESRLAELLEMYDGLRVTGSRGLASRTEHTASRRASELPDVGPMPDNYWGQGGCGALALAFVTLFPELKIAVEWGTGHDEGYVWHAAAYDPVTKRSFDFQGTSHIDIEMGLHGGNVEMDVAPQRVADAMDVLRGWSTAEPWGNDLVFEASTVIEEHWGVDEDFWAKNASLRHTVAFDYDHARKTYDQVRSIAKKYTLWDFEGEARDLLRRVLTEAGFPRGEHAEVKVLVGRPDLHGVVAWDLNEGLGTNPLVMMSMQSANEFVLLHEAAHILRNGPSAIGRVGADVDDAHDQRWWDTFTRLIGMYATPLLANAFRHLVLKDVDPSLLRAGMAATASALVETISVDRAMSMWSAEYDSPVYGVEADLRQADAQDGKPDRLDEMADAVYSDWDPPPVDVLMPPPGEEADGDTLIDGHHRVWAVFLGERKSIRARVHPCVMEDGVPTWPTYYEGTVNLFASLESKVKVTGSVQHTASGSMSATAKVHVPDDPSRYGDTSIRYELGGHAVMDPRDLPPTVYHVTTAGSRIGSVLLADFEKGGGLGGNSGEDRSVSFTISREIAQDIAMAMRSMAVAARSFQQTGRGEEFYNYLVELARDEGWTFNGDGRGYLDVYASWDFGDWMRFWFSARDFRGNRRNPYFFGVKVENWARVSPEDIGYVTATREDIIASGAMVTDFDLSSSGGLREIRVWGDVRVGSFVRAASLQGLHRKEATTGSTFYRVHPPGRPFAAEDATSTPFFDSPESQGTQQGYSCFANPWHLWVYTQRMWGSGQDVVAFSGTKVGTGNDGEDLAVPDMETVTRWTWAEFVSHLKDIPFPSSPAFARWVRGFEFSYFDSWEALAERLRWQDSGDPVDAEVIRRVGAQHTASVVPFDGETIYRGLALPFSAIETLTEMTMEEFFDQPQEDIVSFIIEYFDGTGVGNHWSTVYNVSYNFANDVAGQIDGLPVLLEGTYRSDIELEDDEDLLADWNVYTDPTNMEKEVTIREGEVVTISKVYWGSPGGMYGRWNEAAPPSWRNYLTASLHTAAAFTLDSDWVPGGEQVKWKARASDGKVAGYVLFRDVWDDDLGSVAVIDMIETNPTYARQGVATFLYGELTATYEGVKHTGEFTPEGAAWWAKVTGEHVVPNSRSDQDRGRDWTHASRSTASDMIWDVVVMPPGVRHDIGGTVYVDKPGLGSDFQFRFPYREDAVGLLRWYPDGEISDVWVHPDYRRQGLATEMLRRAREAEPYVDIHHSEALTSDGQEWSRRVAAFGDGAPVEPGTSQIPSGATRLYHVTRGRNLASILSSGLLVSRSVADMGAGSATWASKELDYWRGNDPDAVMIEFYATPDQMDSRLEWSATAAHVGLTEDIPPSQFVAIHEPWHTYYRSLQSRRQRVLDGEFDHALGDETSRKAIEQIKREGARHTAADLMLHQDVYYRTHDRMRAFSVDDATSSPLNLSFDDHLDAPREGYSACYTPWDLWAYVVIQGWTKLTFDDDVLIFSGEAVGDGVDNEPLVVPDHRIERFISWRDFLWALSRITSRIPRSIQGPLASIDIIRLATLALEADPNDPVAQRIMADMFPQEAWEMALPQYGMFPFAASLHTASQPAHLLEAEWDVIMAQPRVQVRDLQDLARRILTERGYGWAADEVEVHGDAGLMAGGQTGVNPLKRDHLIPEILLSPMALNTVGLLHEVAHVLSVGYPWTPGGDPTGGHDGSWRSIYASLLREYGPASAEPLRAALGSRTASVSSLEGLDLRFNDSDPEVHKVTAHEGGVEVGSLWWWTSSGEVFYVHVSPSHQRKGIATGLWGWVVANKEPRLHHSSDLTEEGRAWSQTVASAPEHPARMVQTYPAAHGGKYHARRDPIAEVARCRSTILLDVTAMPTMADPNSKNHPIICPRCMAAIAKDWQRSSTRIAYQGGHRAPSGADDVGAPLHDVEEMMPNYYEHPEWYPHDRGPVDAETSRVIRGAKGQPDKMITIYRALPPGFTTINDGDWVTISRTYALGHAMQSDDPSEDWPVITAEVPARTLWTEGYAAEWGYDGSPVSARLARAEDGSPSLLRSAVADSQGFWYHYGTSMTRHEEGQYVHVGTREAAESRHRGLHGEGNFRHDGTLMRAKISPRNPLGSESAPLNDHDVNILTDWESWGASARGEMPSEENGGDQRPWQYNGVTKETPMSIAARVGYRGAWVHDAFFYRNEVEDKGSISVAIDPSCITEEGEAPPTNPDVGEGQLLLWGARHRRLAATTYFHGTSMSLPVGTQITPREPGEWEPGQPTRSPMERWNDPAVAYATSSETSAWWWAEHSWNAGRGDVPRVYIVEPLGEVHPDPNGENAGDVVSTDGWRVVGESTGGDYDFWHEGALKATGSGYERTAVSSWKRTPGGQSYRTSIVGKNGTTYYITGSFESFSAFAENFSERLREYVKVPVGRMHLWNLPGHWEIHQVQVNADHRRQGVASAMLDLAREFHPDVVHSGPGALTDDGAAWAGAYASLRTASDEREIVVSAEGHLWTWRCSVCGEGPPNRGYRDKAYAHEMGYTHAQWCWDLGWDDIPRVVTASGLIFEIHRGINIEVDFGDEYPEEVVRQGRLAEYVRRGLRDQSGAHWTASAKIAEDFSDKMSRYAEPKRTRNANWGLYVPVVISGTVSREAIQTDPQILDDLMVQNYGWSGLNPDRHEEEITLKPGAQVSVTSIRAALPTDPGALADDLEAMNEAGHVDSTWVEISGPRVITASGMTFEHLRGVNTQDGELVPVDYPNTDALVAREGGKDVGFILWYAEGFLSGSVDMVWVDESHRRKGLATELLRRSREIQPDIDPTRTPWFSDEGKAWVNSLPGVYVSSTTSRLGNGASEAVG